MSEALVVTTPAALPAAPFQIADANFMAALAAIEAEVVDLKITDSASDQKAVDLQDAMLTGRQAQSPQASTKEGA